MTTYMITSSELLSKAAGIQKALRVGDSFVLTHYRRPVGFITPEVPKKLLKQAGAREREEFKSLPNHL